MSKQQITILTILLIAALFLIISGTIVSQKKDQIQSPEIKSVSTFDISPSPKLSPTAEPDPIVNEWREYNNEQYNFSITIPSDWNVEDYASLYPSGGTLIAFSPTRLPCKTCTYFRDGYMSIKIYNEKTDPIFYTNFKQRMSNLGKKKEYFQFQIDNKTGVYLANVAAIENQGWVYEISYDKDKGTADAIQSKLFQKILSSFKFTKLIFEN